MRIWDLPVSVLCQAHLLSEHRELHGLWNILLHNKKGYRHHPETKRWEGKLGALRLRHEAQVEEMARRGWTHRSPLPAAPITESVIQTVTINTLEEQLDILGRKGCSCMVETYVLAP